MRAQETPTVASRRRVFHTRVIDPRGDRLTVFATRGDAGQWQLSDSGYAESELGLDVGVATVWIGRMARAASAHEMAFDFVGGALTCQHVGDEGGLTEAAEAFATAVLLVIAEVLA